MFKLFTTLTLRARYNHIGMKLLSMVDQHARDLTIHRRGFLAGKNSGRHVHRDGDHSVVKSSPNRSRPPSRHETAPRAHCASDHLVHLRPCHRSSSGAASRFPRSRKRRCSGCRPSRHGEEIAPRGERAAIPQRKETPCPHKVDAAPTRSPQAAKYLGKAPMPPPYARNMGAADT